MAAKSANRLFVHKPSAIVALFQAEFPLTAFAGAFLRREAAEAPGTLNHVFGGIQHAVAGKEQYGLLDPHFSQQPVSAIDLLHRPQHEPTIHMDRPID